MLNRLERQIEEDKFNSGHSRPAGRRTRQCNPTYVQLMLKTEIKEKGNHSSKEGNHARTMVYPAWSEPPSEPVCTEKSQPKHKS
jgi:hypothetical protein